MDPRIFQVYGFDRAKDDHERMMLNEEILEGGKRLRGHASLGHVGLQHRSSDFEGSH